MPLDRRRVREALKRFDFASLFIEELGWDQHRLKPLSVSVNGTAYRLDAIAEKRGMVAFLCEPDADEGPMPDYATRRKIENQVRGVPPGNRIVYVCQGRKGQCSRWERRSAV